MGEHAGSKLAPRQAWEAAAAGLCARGEGWRGAVTQATRRAGLRAVPCEARWEGDPDRLAELAMPAVSWIPNEEGGRWLVALGLEGKRVELAIIDESGERRRRLAPKRLAAWLAAELGELDAAGIQWLQIEALLPLAKADAKAMGPRADEPIRRLLGLARLEREDIAVVFVYAVAIGGMSLAVPVAVQALVNTVAFGSLLQPLVVLGILLAGVLGFVAILRVLQAVVVEVLQRRLFVRVASDFARRLPRLAPEARARSYGPELANRFFDVIGLQKAASTLLLDGLALLLQLSAGMLLLALYHPILLVFDLVLIVALLLVIFVGGRGAVGTSLAESTRKYAVAAWIEDLAGSPLRFADAEARAFADARAELLIREWLTARAAHFKRVLRQLVGGVGLQALSAVALLGVGGWLVIERQLTLGQLVAAELVVTAIGAGLGKLGKQLESFFDATTSAAKIAKVLDLPLERSGGEPLRPQGALGLSLRKRPAASSLESDVAPPALLELAAGARVGLRGRGPAHAAAFDHAFGLCTPDKLEARVDGCPIDELDLELLRSEVALVRGVELVAGTILDNLDPRPLASDGRELRAALELAGLSERVVALPEGLHTRLQPRGAPLSEAEARRLMVAQALLRRPRLLLIDGGLDGLGLDDASKARLLDHLFAPEAPWTLLVASDDPAVLERCESTATLN